MSEACELKKHNNKTRPNTWLCEYAHNVTSQFGEDGIIEKILEIIDDADKWCVEFGSWDGKKCSNTYNIIQNKDYSAILIEGSPKRYKDLLKTFERNKKVIPLNKLVGFEQDNCLDKVFKDTEIPTDFDLLSIDIDGNDYHIWECLWNYKPKIVVIEYNPTIPSSVEFIQKRDMQLTQGSSILSMTKLAKSKGYELVAVTQANVIFVDSKYFNLFGINDNSVQIMRTDDSLITHIFCGYDGMVFIRGCCELPWQKIPYKESQVQQLPKWATKKVGDRNFLRKKMGKIYKKLRKKNKI